MNLRVIYHAWVSGAWQQPYREFQEALERSGCTWPMWVGFSKATSEAPTINAVRQYARKNDGAVLYAHTKGASNPDPFRDRWRRSMTHRVVGNWRENLALLESGVDAVGCHWLTEAAYPGMFGPPVTDTGLFGGNFWMARCDYLRTLPECPAEPRWEAERWIGLGHPRVVDLLPGWPHDRRWPELCG